MPVNRWFTRCTTCLVVAAIEEHPSADMQCGICGGGLENMGRVERDRLIHEHIAAPCDDRCTNARGPHCDCHCHGKNHGSRRIVRVVRDAGPIPTVTPSSGREQARLNAAEYRALVEAARMRLDPLIARRHAGYLPYGDYAEMTLLQKALRHAYAARTHTARVKALRAVVGYIPTPAPDPIVAVAEATSQAIATAPPIADTPFSLSHPRDTRRATQTSLF